MARNLSNAAASLLPYSTIEAAASGNVDAMKTVFHTFALMKKRYAGCEPS